MEPGQAGARCLDCFLSTACIVGQIFAPQLELGAEIIAGSLRRQFGGEGIVGIDPAERQAAANRQRLASGSDQWTLEQRFLSISLQRSLLPKLQTREKLLKIETDPMYGIGLHL